MLSSVMHIPKADSVNRLMEITHHSDGSVTFTVPAELLPVVEQSVALAIRNGQIQDRFAELRRQMKVDDVFSVLQQEFFLSRSSLNKIIYPLPEKGEL